MSRMSADERRAQVLGAAVKAFGRTGYAGTSTDVVAREAGVSQPYVVRMFGTKHELFLAAFSLATDRIFDAFRAVLDGRPPEHPFDPDDDGDWAELGDAYTELLADRDLLMVMMHGFAAGEDEAIAARGRRCMAEIYDLLTGTGCTPERATAFIAHGMLLNVMLAMRAPEHLDRADGLTALTACAFGDKGISAASGTASAQ